MPFKVTFYIKGLVFGRLKMKVTKKLKMAYFHQNVCGIQSFVKYNKYHPLLFSESNCSESEDVDVDVPPHVQELVATDNSRFEDWVMQVKAFRVRWFGTSAVVTGNHGNHLPQTEPT